LLKRLHLVGVPIYRPVRVSEVDLVFSTNSASKEYERWGAHIQISYNYFGEFGIQIRKENRIAAISDYANSLRS
jgi:hypothetical protein